MSKNNCWHGRSDEGMLVVENDQMDSLLLFDYCPREGYES